VVCSGTYGATKTWVNDVTRRRGYVFFLRRRGYSGLLKRLRRNEDLGEKGYHRLNNMLQSNQAEEVTELMRLHWSAQAPTAQTKTW
jgi:hypothetical protein